MNALEAWIDRHQLTKTQTVLIMNTLQDHRVISDNCVNPDSVGNAPEAVAWLEKQERLEGGLFQ